MESASCKNKFMSQINSSFGSGGMTLAMNDLQFATFIIHIKSHQQDMPIRKAACVIGRQPCGNVWVLGKDLQVSALLQLLVSTYVNCILYIKARTLSVSLKMKFPYKAWYWS